ncbi:putative bifunctional diguanylate cyclase/phosphodiesterase [Novosphingobium taihuense]|uniref:Diguanylate cyclase (GGDEF)-like protein/PAS domain S-box-containing protein n=1 Tax=Novosphingobium taihuense TaxID=260085 RepID=A0A7W7ESB2_9SPHN|nr:EAL domain-containing protein [Novosphingobium taihuense]MBB4612017.1 diguanylate cyclase (GGDEF)-like protein/PAS domain S-box-containing protein [Novosphingobium taihuense]TWH88630.1 PAS domain S-box-containing protein/diguanylate cyclase (GGDEF)-like protein [Novosphingobium taihuense]
MDGIRARLAPEGLRQWLLRQPGSLLHLLRYDLEPGEEDWFARRKLEYINSLSGNLFEALRMGLMLAICAPGLTWHFYVCAVLLLAQMRVGLTELRRKESCGRYSPPEMVDIWAKGIWLRAIFLSAFTAACIFVVPPERIAAMIIYVLVLAQLELLLQFTMPVAGIISQSISLGLAALALLLRSDMQAELVLPVIALQLLALHVMLFNLHYMFATRILRTRRLKHANQTIQTLLSEYETHASDWMLETDPHGRVVSPSERFCTALGRPANEIEGLKFVTIFIEGSETEAVRKAARSLKPFRDMVVPLVIDGELQWWSLTGNAVFEGLEHTGFRIFVRDVTDRHAAESQVRFLADHDSLTVLPNRHNFQSRLEATLDRSSAAAPFAVLYVDLDHFKAVNDTLGHQFGDSVLVEAAWRIRSSLGEGGFVARLGGDEFACVVEDFATPADLRQIGAQIVEVISQPMEIERRTVRIGASVGIAIAPDHGETSEILLRSADLALYEAKSRGRGSAIIYDPAMEELKQERGRIELDLRSALANGEFELHYQPLHELATDRIAGFEALLRWRHPERGLIPPDVFIPIAEQTGLIVTLGEWVLREALSEAATWPEDMTVAVNVSPAQMTDFTLLKQVISALSASGFDAHRLELEITETMLMQECDEHLRQLERLHALGVRIALDDFGTGYSSLNYLRSFPFDKIKIDRCFITEISAGSESSAIIEAVLDLANKLNMQTIAEGVESEEQLASLRTLGCEQVQGYLISKAVPADMLPIERSGARKIEATSQFRPVLAEPRKKEPEDRPSGRQEARRA